MPRRKRLKSQEISVRPDYSNMFSPSEMRELNKMKQNKEARDISFLTVYLPVIISAMSFLLGIVLVPLIQKSSHFPFWNCYIRLEDCIIPSGILVLMYMYFSNSSFRPKGNSIAAIICIASLSITEVILFVYSFICF